MVVMQIYNGSVLETDLCDALVTLKSCGESVIVIQPLIVASSRSVSCASVNLIL